MIYDAHTYVYRSKVYKCLYTRASLIPYSLVERPGRARDPARDHYRKYDVYIFNESKCCQVLSRKKWDVTKFPGGKLTWMGSDGGGFFMGGGLFEWRVAPRGERNLRLVAGWLIYWWEEDDGRWWRRSPAVSNALIMRTRMWHTYSASHIICLYMYIHS